MNRGRQTGILASLGPVGFPPGGRFCKNIHMMDRSIMKSSCSRTPVVEIAVILLAVAVLFGCRPDRSEQPPESPPTSSAPANELSKPEPQPESQPEPQTPDPTEPEEPAVEPAAVDNEAADSEIEMPKPETPEETARRLGPPLGEHPERLKRFNPVGTLWIDWEGKRVVMVGEVCQREAPLEMFACLWRTKEHEAVVSVRLEAKAVHTGLLAVGAKDGHPVRFDKEYVPATGSEIEVTVLWKDEQGKLRRGRAQDWIRNVRTRKAMEHPWVFGGSGFWTDERTGKQYYLAEGGDFICVSNFPSAMLDLPIQSTEKNNALLFEAFTERIPPPGTPVTIVLTPKPEDGAK